MFLQPPAGILAVRALGISREYTTAVDKARKPDQTDNPARLAALTAMLMVEEDGVLEYCRVVQHRILAPKVLLEDLGVRSRRFYKPFVILLLSL